MEYSIINGELYHHGTKGMRWGIRRYQNKDGSLTPAGKKRYNKEVKKLKAEEEAIKNREATAKKIAKLDAKRQELDARKRALDGDDDAIAEVKTTSSKSKSSTPQKKSVKEMTNEELYEAINRKNLEKQYQEAYAQPAQINKGKATTKRVVTYIGGKVLLPAATSVGKQVATSLLANYANTKIPVIRDNPEYKVFTNNKKKDK